MASCDTPQYLAVQLYQGELVTALKGAKAEKSLLTKFKSHGWVAQQANNTEADELITNALATIEMKAENYELFIEMLRKLSVKGIRDVVDMITGMLTVELLQSSRHSLSLFFAARCPLQSAKGM